MVEDLAEKVAGHNYTLGKSESDALEIIRKWILNMNKTITLQHKEDQAEVNSVRDMIQGCTDSTTNLLSNNVSGYKQTTDSDRSAHTACRNRQCASGDLENAACIDYDRYRKGQKPYLNGDEVPPSCLNSLDEAKIETSDPDTRESMEMCLEKTHTWLLPLHSRYLLCDRRKTNHTNITQNCDRLQKKFEASFCAYELKLSDTCDNHKTCRDKELGVRKITHAEVRISEAARKADHITGKKVLCLFDVFLADNPNKTQTLNRCRALTVDTSPFDIVYPDAPGPSPCIKEPSKPCDDAWKTKEYSKLPVSANTCTACPTPAPPPPVKPVVAPTGFQCTDDNTLCYSQNSGAANMHDAIKTCFAQESRVCTHGDMQELCGSGMNPYEGHSAGWYGDHGSVHGGDWNDEYGTWNRNKCDKNNGGATAHANLVKPYRCCRSGA